MAAAASPADPTLLLVNPHARRGRETFETARERLAGRLNLAGALLTDTPEGLEQAIRDGLASGVRRFVVGGGDGTLSRAAGALQGTDGVLGVLPVGTGNTFAHGLGLPANLEDLVEVLATGMVEPYDVGEVSGAAGTRAFLNSVTMGVSEHLAELLTPEAKRRLGWFAWPLALHRALRATPPIRATLGYDRGETESYPTRQLIIANGRTIAGPIVATPQASGQDGRLEVFSLGGPRAWSSLRLAARAVLGHRIDGEDAHYHACVEVRIESMPPVPLDVDGDIWGDTPAVCRVIPAVLNVVVPGGAAPPGTTSAIALEAPAAPATARHGGGSIEAR